MRGRASPTPRGFLQDPPQVVLADLPRGHVLELAARHRPLDRALDAVLPRPELAELDRAARQLRDPVLDPLGLGAEGAGEPPRLLRGASRISAHRQRQQGRVGLGVGDAADPHRGLAEHVMQRDAGASRWRARTAARPRRRPSGHAPPAGGRGRRRSAARPRGPSAREVSSAIGVKSESAPCASAFIAVARSSGSGRLVIASGSASTSEGRTPATPSCPAGSRWIAVIGGAREGCRDRGDLPSPDGGDRLRGVDHPAAAEARPGARSRRRRGSPRRPRGPGRRRPGGSARRRRAAPRRRAERALGGEQLEVLPPAPLELLRRLRRAAPPAQDAPPRLRVDRQRTSGISPGRDSNPQPSAYKAGALPVELPGQLIVAGPIYPDPLSVLGRS